MPCKHIKKVSWVFGLFGSSALFDLQIVWVIKCSRIGRVVRMIRALGLLGLLCIWVIRSIRTVLTTIRASDRFMITSVPRDMAAFEFVGLLGLPGLSKIITTVKVQ